MKNENIIPQLEEELEQKKASKKDSEIDLSNSKQNVLFYEGRLREDNSAIETLEETIKLLKALK